MSIELPERLADKNDTRKFAAFTLDDGCQDNFVHALPIFRKHNVPFSVFAAAGFVERTRSMWWLTVEELVRKLDVVPFDFGGGVERMPAGDMMDKFEAFRRFTQYVATVDEDTAIAAIDETARKHGIDPLAITARETMDRATLRELASDPLARIEAHMPDASRTSRVSAERLMQEHPRLRRQGRRVCRPPPARARLPLWNPGLRRPARVRSSAQGRLCGGHDDSTRHAGDRQYVGTDGALDTCVAQRPLPAGALCLRAAHWRSCSLPAPKLGTWPDF